MSNYYSSSVALITGAASGIGRELALQAHTLGAEVWACDINETGLAETQSLAEGSGKPIQVFSLDVSEAAAIQAFVETSLPQLDNRYLILINNAGVALTAGFFQDVSVEDMEWLFGINYWGALRLIKGFYPYFLDQNRGHIVNISSVFGLGGFSRQSAYSPSKFALRGLTEVLRMELVGTPIRTTSVHPGGVDTNIVRNARLPGHMAQARSLMVQEFKKQARTQPQKAARIILNALPKGKERVLIGPDAHLMDRIIRLLPTRFSYLFSRVARNLFTDPKELAEKSIS